MTDVGDAARVREQIESLPDANKTLVDLRIEGILHHENQAELQRIDELVRARFLYGRFDRSNLAPSPSDESWLDAVPGGVMQSVAKRLQELSDPAGSSDRPADVSPETAIATILEESAERFQIVLLTCHPERYNDLSDATFFDLEEISSI